MKKKLYLIALTDHVSRALAMLSIKIIAKLNIVTHQVEPSKAWWYDSLNRIWELI